MTASLLSRSQNLRLRQEAVARAEAQLKRSKGTRARHAATQVLMRNRRALSALKEMVNGTH